MKKEENIMIELLITLLILECLFGGGAFVLSFKTIAKIYWMIIAPILSVVLIAITVIVLLIMLI